MLLELEGDKEPLNDVLRGIKGDWPTKAPHQEMALAFYPGDLEVCQRVIEQHLKSIITTLEIVGD